MTIWSSGTRKTGCFRGLPGDRPKKIGADENLRRNKYVAGASPISAPIEKHWRRGVKSKYDDFSISLAQALAEVPIPCGFFGAPIFFILARYWRRWVVRQSACTLTGKGLAQKVRQCPAPLAQSIVPALTRKRTRNAPGPTGARKGQSS